MRCLPGVAGFSPEFSAAIVGGDFNAAPEDAEFRAASLNLKIDLGLAPGAALPPTLLGGLIRDARAGHKAVDHVLVYSWRDAPPAPVVLSRHTLLTEPTDGLLPSDHAAVLVQIRL